MATPSRGNSPPVDSPVVISTPGADSGNPKLSLASEVRSRSLSTGARSLLDLLLEQGYDYEFSQAVRILEKVNPSRVGVGFYGPPEQEAVRFRVHLSLAFPPSQIQDIQAGATSGPGSFMTVAFLGLTGPMGVMPLHYTELLIAQQRGEKNPEQQAFRAWLDLFNHRLISLFHRAWEKYRFVIAYERGEYAAPEPDTFTSCLFSLVGLGLPSLRNRLQVSIPDKTAQPPGEKVLASIDDLVLLYYGGLLSHRPRCAVGLEALLSDFFQLPIRVRQFQGQWLRLDQDNQSGLGGFQRNNHLGDNAVLGERVWDVQGKFRVQVGPLGLEKFVEFTPDQSPVTPRKSLFLLMHLVRLYVGADLAFDVQLILRAQEIPVCQLGETDGIGPHLGWNTWLVSLPCQKNATEACFEGEELFTLDA